MNADATLDEAVAFVAEDWVRLRNRLTVPANLNFRDEAAILAPVMRKSLLARFPDLWSANDQILLMVIARGIERAGLVARARIEKSLGIVLPP